MDRPLEDWFDEYRRLNNALRPYCDRICAKESERTAQRCTLSERERLFSDLCYYWAWFKRTSVRVAGFSVPDSTSCLLDRVCGITAPKGCYPVLNHAYYWDAALVNNADVFGYVQFIIEHQTDFAAIGADGTLRALDQLMPFYREQQEIKDESEKGAYWHRTKEKRASGEAFAEDVLEFARLLLQYAQKNLGEYSDI